MKKIVLFFLCLMLLVIVSGCTQSQPEQAQPTATPVQTKAPRTTLPMVTTSAPTPIVITQTSTPTVSDNTISIENQAFNPPLTTVPKGSIVRWVNVDSAPHSIKFTKVSGINPSGPLSSGQGFSVKFDETGTFVYADAMHPDVQGRIIVV